MSFLRILLADSQPLIMSGLRYLIAGLGGFEVIGEVHNHNSLTDHLKNSTPNLIILDYHKLEGFEIENIIEIKRRYPDVSLLILSSDNNHDKILQVLESGISGFLTKDCSQEEILLALKSIKKGEKFFCHKIYDILLESRSRKTDSYTATPSLSSRETEVLKLIVTGNSTQTIAQRLNLSYHTINSHRKNIIRKLKIKSPTEFVIHAMDLGLISSTL